MNSVPPEEIYIFIFGAVFIVTLIILAIKFPSPTPFQYNVFRTILSLAAAGIAVMIPGFIDIELNAVTGLIVKAGGALAVFSLTFFFNPAKLAVVDAVSTLQLKGKSKIPLPNKLPSGVPFPADQREVFIEVWRSLIFLESAAEGLWKNISDHTLSVFADRLHESTNYINNNAIFFSEEDYKSLQEIIKAANFYLTGKLSLSNIGNGYVYFGDEDEYEKLDTTGNYNHFVNPYIKKQIKQNKRWLTRYKNLIKRLRNSFHNEAISAPNKALK